MANKANRLEVANRNIAIMKKGKYRVPTGHMSFHTVNIERDLAYMLSNSVYVPENKKFNITSKGYPQQTKSDIRQKVEIIDENVVDTIHRLGNTSSVCCLNFASGIHPGGGYLYGSLAQEEALCYSSALYEALAQADLKHEFYDANRAIKSKLYTSGLIYTKRVPFFRDADYNFLLKPTYIDVITCPAANASALSETERKVLPKVMYNRMLSIIDYCVGKADTLILGAYGCGVFGNDTETIAKYWYDILVRSGYLHCFKKIVFAIYRDKDKLNVFKRVWGE